MRILLNPFWTVVSYFKKTRGSLAKRAIERVSANVARWIRDGRLGLDTRGKKGVRPPAVKPDTADAMAGAERLAGVGDFGPRGHDFRREKHRKHQEINANSPSARTTSGMGWKGGGHARRRSKAPVEVRQLYENKRPR